MWWVQVSGFENLFAMEVDPNLGLSNLPDETADPDSAMGMGRVPSSLLTRKAMMMMMMWVQAVMEELVGAFPGIDEAMSFAEVMK